MAKVCSSMTMRSEPSSGWTWSLCTSSMCYVRLFNLSIDGLCYIRSVLSTECCEGSCSSTDGLAAKTSRFSRLRQEGGLGCLTKHVKGFTVVPYRSCLASARCLGSRMEPSVPYAFGGQRVRRANFCSQHYHILRVVHLGYRRR